MFIFYFKICSLINKRNCHMSGVCNSLYKFITICTRCPRQCLNRKSHFFKQFVLNPHFSVLHLTIVYLSVDFKTKQLPKQKIEGTKQILHTLVHLKNLILLSRVSSSLLDQSRASHHSQLGHQGGQFVLEVPPIPEWENLCHEKKTKKKHCSCIKKHKDL